MDTNQSSESKNARRTRDRVNSRIVAVGAALGLTLAGLGIAGAQTDSSTTTTEPNTSSSEPKTSSSEGPAGGHRGHAFHRAGVKPRLAVAAGALGINEEELRTALRSGQSLAQVAQSKNVEVEKVVDALVAEARKQLADKVAAGDITQAQADAKAANLEPRVTALVNRSGLGRHPGGPHGRHPGGPHRGHRGGVKAGLPVAAAAIGISESDLVAALRSGQSIAQVAQSRNVEVQKVVDALVAEAKKRLAEKVAAGDLTQARADEMSSKLEERITAHVNRPGHPRGGFGHGGAPRPGSASTSAATSA